MCVLAQFCRIPFLDFFKQIFSMPFAGENGWLVWKGFISGPKIYFRSKKLVQHMNELCELAASSCQTLMLKHLHFLLKPQGCWMFPDLSSFCGSCQLPPSINHLSSSPLHLAVLLISWCSALLVFCANRPTLLMKWIEIMALVCKRTCVRACVCGDGEGHRQCFLLENRAF